jgi:hypothetical protein
MLNEQIYIEALGFFHPSQLPSPTLSKYPSECNTLPFSSIKRFAIMASSTIDKPSQGRVSGDIFQVSSELDTRILFKLI